MATDCLFCKISRGEIPCQQQYQDDQVLAFYDINPKAKTHILIIPHKHIPSIMSLEEGDEKIMGHLIRVAQKIGKDLNLRYTQTNV